MKIVKQISFEEVLEYFDQTHPQEFGSNDWARNKIIEANLSCNGYWRLIELSPEEILGVWLPHHEGKHGGSGVVLLEIEGATVKNAVTILKNLEDYPTTNKQCWSKIEYWRNKEIAPIFLSTIQPEHMKNETAIGPLFHLDGLHRLLAWGLEGSNSVIETYIAGK